MDISKNIPIYFLNEIVNKYNESAQKRTPVEKCRTIFDGINLLWNSVNNRKLFSSENDVSDEEKFRSLLGLLIDVREENSLLHSSPLKNLAELSPQIMDMQVLEKAGYNPYEISSSLRKRAEDKHRSLFNGYEKYKNGEIDSSTLLKRLANLLYVIRSNINHGEKTPHGPDLEKSSRDNRVCEVAYPVVKLIMDMFLGSPSNYLATYGSLMDLETMETLGVAFRTVEGKWLVEGSTETIRGLSFFSWRINGGMFPVTVYEVVDPAAAYEILDRYEGGDYIHGLIPAFEENDQFKRVVTIYLKRSD